MKRAVILNDLHFGVRNSNPIFLKELELVFEKLTNTLTDGDEIFILGDVFDNRNSITIKAMDCAHRCFSLIEKFPVKILLGNHDIHYTNTLRPNSVEPLLEKFPNITILYDPIEYSLGSLDILFVPWIVPSKTHDWAKIIKKSKASVCMGHFDIQGFMYNSKTRNDKHGFKPSLFSSFDKVYSGHYHFASEDKNISYLGTQYQMTWDDWNVRKGFHIIREDGKIEKVSSGRDLFRKVDTKQEELMDEYEDCFVKLICDSDMKPSEVKSWVDSILNLKAFEVKVVQNFGDDVSVSSDDVKESIAQTQNIKELVVDVAQKVDVGDHIDKDRLSVLIEDIVSEAWDMMGEV